ncbi:glycine cleavage system protein GcvH [Streptomyces zaomyceticus]
MKAAESWHGVDPGAGHGGGLHLHVVTDPCGESTAERKDMSQIPADLRFAESHEWARLESDGTVTVGISDHAQKALGDVVFVELTEVGRVFTAGEPAGVVESVKAASDIYSPVGGKVTMINEELSESPELLNEEPYDSWIFKLKPSDKSELNSLLDAAGYKAAIGD